MSILSFKEINEARSGKETYQPDGTTVTERTKQWRVDTDSNATDDTAVMAHASAVKIGQSHPNHAAARCISRSCQPESQPQKKQWLFLANYSTKWDIRENPLDDPALTEWSSVPYQKPVVEDIHGDAILNSAGDPSDPAAEIDDSRWTSVTSKNVADSVPPWMFAYQDAVNSDTYTIDGKGISIGEAKISAIHLGVTQTRNTVDYRVLTITIHYRGEGDDAGSSGYGSGSGGDEIEPWDLSLLDAGMREKAAGGSGSAGANELRNITNPEDGEFVTAPVPLDGSGAALANPAPDNAVYLQFEVYRKKLFADIEDIFS